jgi:sporulation protein YlmC with PRC-barrel domain
MNIKTIFLAAGAVLALVGASLVASEAATSASPRNESAQTRDLNLQQLKTPGTVNVVANATTGSKAASSSTAPKSSNASANKTDGAKTNVAAVDKDAITADEIKKAVTLTKVEMPKETLASAKIDDKSGEHIGQVQEVLLDAKGAPSSVHVDVGEFLGSGPHVVAINSNRLTYLPDRKIVVADMTKAQIRALPMVKEAGATSGSDKAGKETAPH